MKGAEAVGKALKEGASPETPWPEYLHLHDAIGEIRRWLGDDRQWNQAQGRHWRSLLKDVDTGLTILGVRTSEQFDVESLRTEVTSCLAGFVERPPYDAALRRRLVRVVDAISSAVESPSVLVAAWDDALAAIRKSNHGANEMAVFLSLAAWAGHSSERLIASIEQELFGSGSMRIDGKLVVQDPNDDRSLAEKYAAIRALITEAPGRGRAIVWLQFQMAPVDWEPGGFPVIKLGESVTIYQGEWLRSCVRHRAPDRGLPPEALDDRLHYELRMFLGIPLDDAAPSPAPEDPDNPTAYIRIDVGDEFVGKALDVARENAEALASLGALYGANPTLWSLDSNAFVFIDGGSSGTHLGGRSAIQPSVDQWVAVHEDRTSTQLRALGPKLGPRLPVRDPDLERATTLLGWLRQTRSAPPPLSLVLCDRVVESVAGWAGMRSMDRMVIRHLIPWWAYSRIRGTAISAAYALFWGRGRDDSSDAGWATQWAEIVKHEPLQLQTAPANSIRLGGLVSEAKWVLQRLRPDSQAAERLRSLEQRTRTGAAAAAWWKELEDQAKVMEHRRVRTRNALMHGGPLATPTVTAVAPFAENLASEALTASVEAILTGVDCVDYFLDRAQRLGDMRKKLADGAAPGEILFPE